MRRALGRSVPALMLSVAQGVLLIPLVLVGNIWFGLAGVIWALTVSEVTVFHVGVVMWLASVARSTAASPRAARSAAEEVLVQAEA